MSNEERTLSVLADPWYRTIFLCYSDIMSYTQVFFENLGFKNALLPITTGSISSPMGIGSDSIPVKVNLLGLETYLADSMQFLLEYALRLSSENVFYVMPTFRGEANDDLHLSQFFHSEMEMQGGLEDMMLIAEQYVRYLASKISQRKYYKGAVSPEHYQEVLAMSQLDKFNRISFVEALSFLEEQDKTGIELRDGLKIINSIGEKLLMSQFGSPIWLTHFEHNSVPFYQGFTRDKQYSKTADLLFGIGETLGSGERADFEELTISIANHQVDPTSYKWYLDMKQNYPMRTSGFGLGVERFMAWLFGIDDIRNIPYVYRENGKSIMP